MDPSVVESSLVGHVLGEKYRIEYQVGLGGFGIVYCATHIGLGKPRAVKVLRQLDRDRRKRFELEARALAELDHPYIVSVVDVGVIDQGNPFLVMEFVDGKSLGDLITLKGKLPLSQTLSIMKCVCSAVHYAHERGIIHRDLKPSNIIVQRLSGEGEIAKVLDFGLAKFLQEAASDGVADSITQSGMILGTVEYLSPEQCAGQPTDARSDIYALGVILYQMLTGDVPYTGESPFAVLTQHVNAPPPRLRDLCPDLPTGVEQVVRRAMAKDPAKRPQTALQLRDELEKAVLRPSQLVVEETEEAPTMAFVTDQQILPSWRHWLLDARVLAGAAVLLAAAFSALYLSLNHETMLRPWEPEQGGFRESFEVTKDGRPNRELWDAPQSWKIVPQSSLGNSEGPNDGSLLVQGPALGIMRTPEGTTLRGDFALEFKVTLERGRKIAWALRVQSPDDYYLFELFLPQSKEENGKFQGYVYSRAEEPHPFSPIPHPVPFNPPQQGDTYWVTVTVMESTFNYQLTRDNPDSPLEQFSVKLKPRPQLDKYQYGSIGFGGLAEDEAIKIENVKIFAVQEPADHQRAP